jgi:hypothetical protein
MGRKARTSSQTELISLRLGDDELEQLVLLQVEQGHKTRSDTLRWALGVAAGKEKRTLKAPGLVHRLCMRQEELADRPLQDDEILLRAVDLKAQKSQDLEILVLPALETLLLDQVNLYGWCYPSPDLGVSEVLRDVKDGRVDGPRFSGMGRIGVAFLQSRMPAFWQTRKGPVESFSDPVRRRSVLRHLLGLSTANKPWDISLSSLRRGFLYQFFAVSFFRPSVAGGIYRRWLGETESPVVWDPSAGFGARMLGFFAEYPNGTYCANEPAKTTFHDLETLAEDMPGVVQLQCRGSEFEEWEENIFDLVFTSPPYFDTEKYFEEPGQVWVEYPDIASWREKQVKPTLEQAYRGVKPGGHVIININQEYRDTFLVTAQEVGFVFVQEDRLMLHRSHFARKGANKDTRKYEPILVFQKVVETA